MRFSLFCFVVILLIHVPDYVTSASSAIRVKEQKILEAHLASGYDKRIRPPGQNETDNESQPVVVKINMFVRAIPMLCSKDMVMESQLTFRQQWTDPRLSFNDDGGKIKFLTLTDESRVWTPDVFFSSAKEGSRHNVLNPNTLLRIYPNGDILYSTRISLTTACPMDLKYYPHDYQECIIKLASYGYTTDDLILKWKENDPIQVTRNLNLPFFTLINHKEHYATSKTNTGEYSAIYAGFTFKRESSYHMKQVYIPTLMFVILSYISFWIKKEDRQFAVSLVSLIGLTFFTLLTMNNLPKVSYTRSIDIWTGVCLTFAMGAFGGVLMMSQLPQKLVKRKENGSVEDGNTEVPAVVSSKPEPVETEKNLTDDIMQWLSNVQSQTLSRTAYPAMFVLFTLIYWLSQVRRNPPEFE